MRKHTESRSYKIERSRGNPRILDLELDLDLDLVLDLDRAFRLPLLAPGSRSKPFSFQANIFELRIMEL